MGWKKSVSPLFILYHPVHVGKEFADLNRIEGWMGLLLIIVSNNSTIFQIIPHLVENVAIYITLVN